MLGFVNGMIETLGAFGVALLMFLENVFPPVPSELIMPLAGFVSARGTIGFWTVVLAGTVGSLLGATLWYVVGRKLGEERLRDWVDEHGRWLTMSGDDVDRAMRWFERHGGAAVFFGRLVPGIRTLISLPAGFAGMPVPAFLLWSTIGTFGWTAALTVAGRMLGSQFDQVSRFIDPVSWAILGILAVIYVVRIVRWKRSGKGG